MSAPERQPETHQVDIAVIGAGPTGLFAAYYAGFRGLSVAVVDSLPEPGGQITAMYPEKKIYDVAGFPEVLGKDLVANLVAQADSAKPTYLLGRKATTLDDAEGGADSGLVLGLDGGAAVHAGAVLITAGIGEFTPRPLPAADGWLGKGVVHFVPELDKHRGEHVIVVGGGDSAFDWVLALHPIAASVTLVHRRSRFRAAESVIREVEDLGVSMITDAEIVELRGDPVLNEVEIAPKAGERLVLPADTVVAALGFVADLGPISSWGLEVTRKSISVDSTMATARERVYAAGDVASYPGKVNLIATGFGEAATAVNNIAVALQPGAKLFPGHSTDI
ncbi:NAD(P)/FAD-dependent oxidoreductase [Haloechinothrix sp. LS1_15]|uniref:NAD(P)/FAD-dependent oxidoreductase n=1 Tax=Haloechinothrix sp. LS1_15 TaxID=2652248 RepID=UPI002945E4C1|nr:NAD(P)/FAD-dependent oxidoreductase [Haloechinothrix sp. LS1_15]MDV6011531.1 NAD(P)/FAD-dependent oxidoreductase [Haloechinothrix sp. LS1_15]